MAIETRPAPWRSGLAAVLLLLLGGCGLISSVINTTVNTASQLVIPAATAKVAFACIPEGTLIDTPSGPVAIQTLRAGDRVIGFDGEAVRILQKHSYAEDPQVEFLTVRFTGGAQVDLCGMHRIAGVRAMNLAPGDVVAGYRVERTYRHAGVIRSYDLLTEDAGYRIQGVPVNSMIEEMAAAERSGRVLEK